MVRLSEKHGVNPCIEVCFFCNEEKNSIILFGMLKGDVEAPRKAVINDEPCDKCKGYMEQGIILISVDEKLSKDDMQNPYRTGEWCVVKEEFLKRTVTSPELLEAILKKRVCFLPDDAWDRMGLPRHGSTGHDAKGEEPG